MQPLAQELGRRGYAVLEPFQTRHSVDGQIKELSDQISRHCAATVTVIGWSWGAWLGCLFAAKNVDQVGKLVLVGSGPFDPRYTSAIRETKAARLTKDEWAELKTLRVDESDAAATERFFALSDKADTFARDASPQPKVTIDRSIHETVWPEAERLRENGGLLQAVAAIRCPVLAIQGDFDPRPSDGVRVPLQTALPTAQFVELARCGHKPWQERHAKAEFLRLLDAAIS